MPGDDKMHRRRRKRTRAKTTLKTHGIRWYGMPKHRHYNLMQVIYHRILPTEGRSGPRPGADQLPGRARHGGRSDGIRYAQSALERSDAHHVGVSLGRFVGVLEANVLVAVIPGCDTGEESTAD